MANTASQAPEAAKYSVDQFCAYFAKVAALRDITLTIPEHQIFGIIGPAGAGKTTFLRCLNRLSDLHADFHATGEILLDGQDIYHPDFDVVRLRRRVGIVFALPIPLPMTIHDNITYGPKLSGIRDRAKLNALVETSLQSAFLWNEVKDRLHTPALRLSGGQQQRLCLARALALEPEVILLDEPCSGLDPISTARIEEAMTSLKTRYTFILVTNNTKQAARVADQTAFFLMGELVEVGLTKDIFTVPQDKRTNDYVTGRFG